MARPNFANRNVRAKGDKSFIGKSRFITTPDHLTTFNAGYIVPVFIKKTQANSSYKLDLASIIEMPTLINRFYGKAFIDCYAFFATDELLFDKYEDYIGEGKDNSFNEKLYGRSGRIPNTESGGPITPTLFRPQLIGNTESGNKIHVSEHSIHNYLGLPLGDIDLDKIFIDACPWRFYHSIYNNYFRSGFLQDPKNTDFGLGTSDFHNFALLKACKLPDYFTGYQTTSPQLFDDIAIGLSGEAPVVADSRFALVGVTDNLESNRFYAGSLVREGSPTQGIIDEKYGDDTYSLKHYYGEHDNAHSFTSFPPLSPINKVADIGGINPKVVLDDASEVSLNAIRMGFALQHISEKSLLGTDLKSLAKWAWGLNLNDFHLDKPLYIGGSRIPLQVNAISQTTPAFESGENAVTTPLGYKAGQSSTIGRNLTNVRFNSPMTGWVMVVIVIRQENVYEYGIDRNLTIKDRFDEYWREFIGAGNQKTYNYEIFYDDKMTADELHEAFGFAPYAEHIRRDLNRISGYFSSKSSTSLNTKHLGSVFTSLPHLGNDFIESDADEVFDRLIAVESDKAHQFEGYFYFKYEKITPVPMTSNPGLRSL